MQKKSLFKKIGAVVMAVAMTAMMIPGVVSAKTYEGSGSGGVTLLTDGTVDCSDTLHNIDDTDVVMKFYASSFTADAITVDKSAKTATFKNLVCEGELSTAISGWKFIFEGDNSFMVLQAEDTNTQGTQSEHPSTADISIDVKAGGKVVSSYGFGVAGASKVALCSSVTADPAEWKNTNKKVTLTCTEEADTSKIVDGDGNETISASSDKDLVLICEKNLPDTGFKFFFGEKELTSEQYKAEKGSTKVTIFASYLDTLDGGDYEAVFSYPDGDVKTTVTLTKAAAEEESKEEAKEEKKSAKTGEFTSTTTVILLISMMGLAGAGFYAKKKELFK